MSLGHDSPQPVLWVLIGLPGCGKSTWLKENLPPDTVVISSDEVIQKAADANGIPYCEAFRLFSHEHLVGLLKRRCRAAVEAGRHIAIDRVNLHPAARRNWTILAPGHLKVAVVFEVSPDQHARNLRAVTALGKTVPGEALEEMRKRYCGPTASEGFDRVLRVRDGRTVSPTATAA